jgi:hypothetical protein
MDSTVGDAGNGVIAEEAQTFRVGVTGRLSAVTVDVQVGNAGNGLLLEIRRVTPSGLPSDAPNDLLAAAVAYPNLTAPPQLLRFDLSRAAPQVEVGEQLALVLIATGSGSYAWLGMLGDPYTAGTLATRSSYYGNQWAVPDLSGNSADLGFQTFVEPVPEPSAVAVFLVCGLGMVALTRRKRASWWGSLEFPRTDHRAK